MYHVICQDAWYGIRGVSVEIYDITTSEHEIRDLTDLLNRNDASELHIFDIIEDWFGR